MNKLGVIITLLATFACSPKLQQYFCTIQDVQRPPADMTFEKTQPRGAGSCFDHLSYIPDASHLDHTPMKYLRVNFHWLNTTDSARNYTGNQAINFTYKLLEAINDDLADNKRSWLPHNNNNPVLPTLYRFKLTPRGNDPTDTGIYFHFDDELSLYVHKGANANIHDRRVINTYGVQLDSVLNIFIMPHHPDSVASPTYGAYGVGVALGNAVKAAGMFENGGEARGYRGIFNHEVGHIFGLSHTWAFDDGCDDTPRHPNNCWTWTPEPPCDTLASNNVMDYNAQQNAWTACQIGRIHWRMAQEHAGPRKLLQPNWCRLHDDRHIQIRDTVEWRGAKDLEGHLTILSGAMLKINCRVALPAFAKITVQPGATLVLDEHARLHNACGERWEGIEIQQLGNQKGQVIFIGSPKIEHAIHTL